MDIHDAQNGVRQSGEVNDPSLFWNDLGGEGGIELSWSGRNSLDVPNLAGSLPGSYPGNSLLGSSYPGNMLLGSMGADDVSQGVPSVVGSLGTESLLENKRDGFDYNPSTAVQHGAATHIKQEEPYGHQPHPGGGSWQMQQQEGHVAPEAGQDAGGGWPGASEREGMDARAAGGQAFGGSGAGDASAWGGGWRQGPEGGGVATDAEPLKCGWLRKRTSGGWGWRKRWFVLSQTCLCYYTDPNNLGVQKTLNFDGGGLRVAKGQESNELAVKCHERTLFLRASSQWEATQWVMAFQLVMVAFGSEWMRQFPTSKPAETPQPQGGAAARFMPRVGGGWFGGSKQQQVLDRAPSAGWQGAQSSGSQDSIAASEAHGGGSKRKQLDVAGGGSVVGADERPSKIASPAPSREGTEHGEDRSLRAGIRSLDNSQRGMLSPDGTGHGQTGFYSLDSSHRFQDNGAQPDWHHQEVNRKILEQAAQSLQQWTLNERNSPAASVHGSECSMQGLGRTGSSPRNFQQQGVYGNNRGQHHNPEDYVSAAQHCVQQQHQQQQQQASASAGRGGSPSVGGEGCAGGVPVKPFRVVIFPEIPREKFEFLPPTQRNTLTRQMHNQKNPHEVNPAVIKAGLQAMDLSLRKLAHQLLLRPRPATAASSYACSQVLSAAWSVFRRALAEGKLRLEHVTSAHLTSVALKQIIRGHAEAGAKWPQVHEDTGLEGSQMAAKYAGDLACELFPFIEMAKEAELLPPVLLPLIFLIDNFERSSWPSPMELQMEARGGIGEEF